MTDKTPIGVDLLDRRYGGTFRGRPLLFCGPSGSGKTAVAFHFLKRGLRLQERCLLLTARPSADIVVQADAMGFEFSEAVASGNLILLEYADDVPGRHNEAEITLPPDSFMQLANVVSEQAVARLVLDTCLPWVAVKSAVHLEEHVFSFIRSLDRMGVSTLLTMPKAVSLAATRLYKLVEAQVPVSVTLDLQPYNQARVMIVNKYLGMDDKVGSEFAFQIRSHTGISEATGGADEPEAPSAPDSRSRPAVAGDKPPALSSASGDGVRFSADDGLRFAEANLAADQSDLEERHDGDGEADSQDVW